MLVLSRKVGQEIVIGEGADRVVIIVTEVRGREQVRLGITAPRHISVHRSEVRDEIDGQSGG
jgi:carbon storage regulator